MPIGGGKYDDVCTHVRELAGVTEGGGVILIIIGGGRGSGFSVQANLHVMEKLPDLLEDIAAQIRQDLRGNIS
jgi:hypothetical protein